MWIFHRRRVGDKCQVTSSTAKVIVADGCRVVCYLTESFRLCIEDINLGRFARLLSNEGKGLIVRQPPHLRDGVTVLKRMPS